MTEQRKTLVAMVGLALIVFGVPLVAYFTQNAPKAPVDPPSARLGAAPLAPLPAVTAPAMASLCRSHCRISIDGGTDSLRACFAGCEHDR